MSATFQFMHLTLIPQQRIIQFFSFSDFMKFSLISARCKHIAQLQKRRRSITNIRINLDYDKELMVMVTDSHRSYHRAGKVECLIRMLRRADERHFRGLEDTVMIDWTEPTEESRMAALERTVKHVRDVFNSDDFILQFKEPYDLRNSFLWNTADSPRKIELLEWDDPRPDDLKISIDNVKFVLEESSFDMVSIGGRIEPGYTCSTPLTAKSIYLKYAHWLRLDALLNMTTTEELMLEDEHDPFSSREIRLIIERWLSGGMENLKSITISVNDDLMYDEELQDRHVELILDGLGELKRSDGKTARLEFHYRLGLRFVVE